MRKPNFLIVGAAKSGTTSLFEYLRGHPDVFMPNIKEASYFAGGGGRSEADYLALFRKAGPARAVGEASGAYLYHPSTPLAIHELLGPDTRIVIILRNPVDMAYSLWGHMVREGGENLSFSDALAAEAARMEDPAFPRRSIDWRFNFAYTDRARYARQVDAYLRTFDPRQVRVLIFEEFFADVGAGFADLCRFLGVRPDYHPVFRPFNQAAVVRSERLRRLVDEPSLCKDVVKAITPPAQRQKMKAWLNAINYKAQKLPALSSVERERLWRLFEGDVAELEALLGRRLDCWGPEPVTVTATRAPLAAHVAPAGAQGTNGRRYHQADLARDLGEQRVRPFAQPPLADDSGE